MFDDHKYIQNLSFAPVETSIMGCIKGAADYFGINISIPWLFGTSGHAFLINIHSELCPSGPYCWKFDKFHDLLKNTGINMVDLGYYDQGSTAADLTHVENKIKNIINTGNVPIILNMENQLIVGYNEHALILKPGHVDLPFPSTLTYGTWKEFHNEFHANVYEISKLEPKDNKFAVEESLKYAISVANGPAEDFTDIDGNYMTGFKAYDQWINAINNGHGSEHGNWWNGTVWSECRTMAANFFLEIPEKIDSTLMEICGILSGKYKSIAKGINIVKKKDLDNGRKIEILEHTKQLEIEAINKIKALVEKISNL